MRKIRKRVFAAVLAAALLFTMPGMASYAEAEDAQTKDISESVTVQAEDDAAEEKTEAMQESEAEDNDMDKPGTGEDDTEDTETDVQEPAEDETVPTQKEDVEKCFCGTLCTQDSINGDCPVCGAEDADLSRCKGEKTENSSKEKKEDAGQGDTGAQDDSANLCAHHKEHTKDCGYSRASEDGEGKPCTYDCRICPIEDLIAALPDEVTEDNAEKVRAQLNKILALYRELTAEEQEQIDLFPCWDLQAALDETNAPMTAAAGDVTLTTSNKTVTFTEDECSGNCQGHIITQNTTGALQGATIIVESGTHNVTFSDLNLTISKVGVMPDATMNLTLVGTSMIQGYECGIYVPENATLVINGSGSLDVSASDAAAGIGGAFYDPNGNLGNRNCGTVTINGGTITATGASTCAGIGGAADATPPGNGGTVTINGGAVTATGGGDGLEGGAGIGGGTDNGKSGSGGTLTINGGNVTLTAGHSSAYGFGRGSGSNSNAGTLTLADANCLASGTTLDPKGTYSINGDPTEDMIVVPKNLVYTGKPLDVSGIKIDDSKTGTATYFEQTFNVSANADGWDYTIAPAEVKEAGEYTVTFTKGGKSISTTFTVAECPHTGLAYEPQANNKHGGTCPVCGEEVSEEHTWVDGTCEDCNLKAAVKVEIGNATTYYGDIRTAWTAAKGNTATVTLLANVTASYMAVTEGDDITFDGGEFTLTGLSNNNKFIDITGGKLTVTGGTLKTGENTSGRLSADITISGGELVVTGCSLEAGMDCVGLAVMGNAPVVKLSGGTFHGIGMNTDTVGRLLLNYGSTNAAEKHYAYYQGDEPVDLTKLEKQNVLTGTVTVKECEHKGVTPTPNNDGTHTLKCPYCGYTEAAANCTYGTEYQHNDTNHWQTCTVCGYQKTETHTLNLKQGDTVNGVTQNREACDCGFFNAFTVTVTVPSGLTYGNTGGKRVAYTVNPVKSGDAEWELTDMQGKILKMEDDTLPANLPVGDYRLWIYGSNDSKYVFVGTTIFTVSAAPLTGEMVTLSTESVTYSGAEQKPTITVKQGDTMLAERTDYDYTYSSSDFTNAGTITVTITGKGNYTETVKTTYTIKKAPLTITASDQTITYSRSITQNTDNVSVAGLCSGDSLNRITLTASTAYVPGGNITPSAAGIKNSGGKDVTGNYKITYKDGGLTINKADAEITVGTDTYNKTFGNAAFALDVTDNNTEADVQYEVTAGADVISVSNGTVTIKNAGTAAITVSLPETANYNAAASKTITVNVAQKGGYTVAQQKRSYLYSRENTGSIDLAALLPKDCGTVTYGTPVTSGIVTYSAAPAVNDGKLSYTLNSGNIDDEGIIIVTVATRNYTDITITVKVKLTDRLTVSEKKGKEVTLKNDTLTYGEKLSKLVFDEAAFVDSNMDDVEGSLAWKDEEEMPDAGTASAVWVFTPSEDHYEKLEGNISITVNKAVPEVTAPTVSDRVYNPSLSLADSDLSGGSAKGVDGKALEGTWSWKFSNIVPTVGNSGYEAVFTPDDANNYETAAQTIPVTVTKATPYIATLPTASSITYGDTLDTCALSGGTVQYGNGAGQPGNGTGNTEPVAGAFTWKEPSTKPAVPDSETTEYTVVFTPDDTVNYETAEVMIKLTVQKAAYAPNMPKSAMEVSNSIKKVGDTALPEGWKWQDADKDTALEAGTAVYAMAVYIGADKGNYENETVAIAITRSACDHVAGEDIFYTGEGEKAPTCTEDGLGHRECTKCGSVMESGVLASALGHDYTSEVTKEPNTSAEGEKTYTCSGCGDTYTESIPRTTPEGLWVSGLEQSYSYTGSVIKPEGIRVYHGTTLLREKTEYTISYKNNTRAGTAQVIVTGKGSYKGKATAEFTIEAVDLSTNANVLAFVATGTETGKKLKPAVTVTWNGKKLKEKTNYTLTYDANIKTASTEGYDVTISGKGNYTGTIVRKFRIVPKGTLLLNSAKVTGIAKSYPYQEGKEIPEGLESDINKLSVKIGKTLLTKDTDYTIRVENGNTVGTGTIVLEAAQTSAYAGEKRISFNVTGINLKKCYITGLEKTYPYTGKPVKPEVSVYTGKSGTGTQIPPDAYTVRYSNYINQGKATLIVTGKASKGCSGSILATYTIGRLNLATEEKAGNITVTMPDDIKYAKGGAKPQPVITHTDSIILREGVDYTVKYSNNTSINGKTKPALKITGTGNYCGTITKNFDIGAQDIGTLEITAADKAYNSKKKGSYYYSVPKVYDLDGKQLKSGKDYTVRYTNAVTGQEIGKKDMIENGTEICVTVTATENSNYIGTLSTTYFVRIAKDVKDISKAKYDKIASRQYTGSEIKPEVRLYTLTGKTKNYLTEDDYEIIGYYNNVKKGTATILIRGINAYSGVKSITFRITAADNQSIWSGMF